MSIRDELDHAEQERGDRKFLHFGEQSWTFGEYVALTRAAAGAWSELGIRQGELAAISLPNSAEFLAAFHGLASLGSVMVPLNTYFKPTETRYVLHHSGAKVLLTTSALYAQQTEEVRDQLPALERVIFLDEQFEGASFKDILDARLAPPRPAVRGDEVAVILFTSGTTGMPKGCMNPHDHFTINGRALSQCFAIGPDDVHMTVLPLFHQNCETTSTGALITGCQLVLGDRFHPSTFWRDVHHYGVTHAGYLGSIIPLLDKIEDPLERDSPLRVFWGAGLSAEAGPRLEERWGLVFIEVFGMSETGLDLSNPIDGIRKPGSCGIAVPGKNVKIVDDDGNECPPDVPGQIVVEIMPAVTKGYLNNSEATTAALHDGWMHTGDMARMDRDGYVFFLDRYKDIVRRSGENISSAEVEGVLRGHPSVLDVAVIPVADYLRGEEVKAVVVLRDGASETDTPPEVLSEFCRERLAYFKVPRFIEFRADLPRTSTNKVQKQPLREEHGTNAYYDLEQSLWLPAQSEARV